MRAEIVIIGGGAVGCGVAYSLARHGKTDVLLIEKEPTLASVTTSQAAGLVGQVRTSLERTQLAMWSVRTFAELQQDEKANPAWRQVGSLRISLSDDRTDEFRQMKSVADRAGLEVEFIDNALAQQKWPMMNFDKVKSVLWCPSDGYLQPSDLTMAYAAAARRAGVQFKTNTRVKRILTQAGHVTGVETEEESIECDTVINAAGAHAYHVATSVGLELPIVPVRHEFFVTVHTDSLSPDLPVVRIPDATLYLRADTTALLCGGWEPDAVCADPRQIAADRAAPPIEEDWQVLGQFAENLAPHLPDVNNLGIRSVFRGWPTFTPDGRFIIGESCRVRGFVMAGGCNAHGVSGSAGIGRHVVEAAFSDDPSPYVRSLSPDRFTESSWDWDSAQRQARRCYETYYCLEH